MTFQEYINQSDPVKKPTVYLEMSDLSNHWTIGKQTWVELSMFGEYFTYFLDQDGVCWSTDSDGNKVSISCFRLLNYVRK